MLHVDFTVRIGCSTYNHAPYIHYTMNGFCMQHTDFPFICIILDDASTDGEQRVIKDYLDKYFIMNDDTIKMEKETNDYTMIFTRHKSNINCYFAVYFLKYNHYQLKKTRNSYLITEWLSAKYIASCEGDDYWTDPLKLQKQVDFLDAHPDYVMCSHDFKVYSEAKKIFTTQSSYSNLVPMPFTYTLDNFFQGDWIQTLTIMYRNLTHPINIPRKKYTHYRDRVYHYYYLKNGKGCLLPDVMGVYRKHSGGVLSGRKAEENYYIYMSIALDIYHIENEPRALQLLRRHALGLFNYRWNHHQKKELIRDFRYLFAKAPFPTTTGLLISFIGSMLKNKLSF